MSGDRHDPRDLFRQLVTDTPNGFQDRLMAFTQALAKNDILEVSSAGQALGIFVVAQMQESNRLGRAEGQEQQDITALVYGGAVRFAIAEGESIFDYEDDNGGPDATLQQAARVALRLWTETRQQTRALQDADAKVREAAAQQSLAELIEELKFAP